MGTLLLIILILLLIGGLPTWPYSQRWGYGPSGGFGVLLVILLLLLFFEPSSMGMVLTEPKLANVSKQRLSQSGKALPLSPGTPGEGRG